MNILHVAVGVIKNTHGQILISLREPSLHQGSLWEFPGGKLEFGETAQQALIRELNEELAITVLASTPLMTIKHHYPELTVQLHVFLVDQFSGLAKGNEGQTIKWVTAAELTNYQFPAANQAIIMAAQLPCYYAILDDSDETQSLIKLSNLLNRGIKLIQLRFKATPPEQLSRFIKQAYPLCQKQGARLLINSSVNNAQTYTLDGLHLTSRDLMSLSKRPTYLSSSAWLAASCHNLLELQHAQQIGVDFVVLAPVLTTKSHPDTPPLGWEKFTDLIAQINLPAYALGGLTEANLIEAHKAGSLGIAAIRAFLES
jgi:8-oxo-dGTP diphosphatase